MRLYRIAIQDLRMSMDEDNPGSKYSRKIISSPGRGDNLALTH